MNNFEHFAPEQRLEWLRDQLTERGSMRIGPAASELGVSEMTVRRDLQELEERGIARRVRGGAVPVGPTHFSDRHRQHARAKHRIAAKLLDLVPEEGAVGFDASSTIMRLAATIDGARDLMVLTNGLETFHALDGKAGIRPLLTGGELDPRTDSLVGPLAAAAARQVMLRKLFVSAAAVDPRVGASEAALEEAEIKHAMLSVADAVVLALDSSKLGSRAVASSLAWDDVSLLVTELDPHDPALGPYRGLVEIL